MNEIVFADGAVLSLQDIRDKTVADMKASGVVIGSEYAENYVHALGDGSYVITDYDPGSNSATDRFTFTDVNADDVTFSRINGNDLFMELASGGDITVKNHFDSDLDYRMDTIAFADGTVLDGQGILDKIVSDSRPAPTNGDAIDLTAALRDIAVITSSSSHPSGDNAELIDGVVGEDNFASTQHRGNEWQQIDLGSEYSVNSIILTNRVISDQYASRLDGAVVPLLDGDGNSVHTFDPISGATSGSVHQFDLTDFADVQTVRIGHYNQYLSIAEVQVFGTSSNVQTCTSSDDAMAGETGTDVFLFKEDFGVDQVTGFEDGTDLVRFEFDSLSFSDLNISDNNGDAEIAVSDHGTITLSGINTSLLTEEDFVFV